jgi:hypothetical protein
MNAGIQNGSVTCVCVRSFHGQRAVNADILSHYTALWTYTLSTRLSSLLQRGTLEAKMSLGDADLPLGLSRRTDN